MVTIMLLGVVLALSMTAFISLQNATTGADERSLNMGQARLLMQRTTRDLRTAVRLQSDQSPFTLAKPNEAKLYANLSTSGAPSLVRFYIDSSSRLVEERTDAGGTAPNWTFTGTAKSRYVAEYVVNGTGSTQPFAYYDKAGATLSFDSSCTCLVAADLLRIDSVGITFSVRHGTKLSVAPTTLVNRVTLPNVDYLPLTSS
jgi:type II secretory pathway pseudopilin PulG